MKGPRYIRAFLFTIQFTNFSQSAILKGDIMALQVKLAELLLRRKELDLKVKVLSNIKANALFEVKATRKQLTDSLDDIVASVPKLSASQVTAEFDWHSRQLRLCDAAIQQANWTTLVEVDQSVMGDYVAPVAKTE
jgi:3-methyladenine DNA glycosylase AlkC